MSPSTTSARRHVALVGTGGTIASRPRVDGALVAAAGTDLLVRPDRLPEGVDVTAVDASLKGSFQLDLTDQLDIVGHVRRQLADPTVEGVVVTHGTDTMEETAFMAALCLDDPRPVVFTGAQRGVDVPDGDGPRNLRDALTVASCGAFTGQGALIVFDGLVLPAEGTRKVDTAALRAFECPAGPLGYVDSGDVEVVRRVAQRPLLARPPETLDQVRVDVVASYPGADGTLLQAAVAAGARGVVLQATGIGNVTPGLFAATREAVAAGVVVGVCSRVAHGTVAAVYGDGGGADLDRAGAVLLGRLQPSQSMVLLACLLGRFQDPRDVIARLREHVNRHRQ